MRKNIGWFDRKENAPGELTSVLAEQAQIINGVSAEGLASQMEAFCSLFVAVVIGFIYSWPIAFVSMCCIPFMLFGFYMSGTVQSGISEKKDALCKEANILAGDSIANYKTVASFANEDQLVKEYAALL